ncbi:hypothetical protein ACFWBX_31215, partial [Streptomyces sp. NPDC059991]|uniref:hypothetical protein n=1 Tax=Streptomyces sp. NPDC059991 TaxID=3347028 RepID=UPI00367E5C5B
MTDTVLRTASWMSRPTTVSSPQPLGSPPGVDDMVVRRWLASGVLAAGVFTVSGCGGGARSNPEAAPTAVPTSSARSPVTATQLKALTFKPDELPQASRVVVQEAPTGDPAETVVKGSPTSCQTVLDVINAKNAHTAVNEIFNWKDNIYPG